MSQGIEIVIAVLVFACAFLAMQTLIGFGKQAMVQVKLANARLRRLDGGESSMDYVVKMRDERSLDKEGNLAGAIGWINALVTQSGAKLGKWGIYAIMAGLALILPLIGFFLGWAVWVLPLSAVAGAAFPILVLRFLVNRRRNKLGEQLPEALDVIVRSLGAGHPVPVAMNMVAKEMPDPIGSEFGIATDEISFGSSLSKGIARMSERIGHPDFDLFAATIRLQEKTGGNLAELLKSNAKTIRDRQRMRLKIKSASAEGRSSAMILNVAPIVLFFAIQLIAPDFYGSVEGHSALKTGFIVCGVWMFIGNMVMRRMINFRI